MSRGANAVSFLLFLLCPDNFLCNAVLAYVNLTQLQVYCIGEEWSKLCWHKLFLLELFLGYKVVPTKTIRRGLPVLAISLLT